MHIGSQSALALEICPLCNQFLQGDCIERVWENFYTANRKTVIIHSQCAWNLIQEHLFAKQDIYGSSEDWIGWSPQPYPERPV